MTTATIALTELAEKGADIDVLRQMVQFMAQRLMELDVEGRCGAGCDEKLTDGEVANVSTYLRSSRRNQANAVSAQEVFMGKRTPSRELA